MYYHPFANSFEKKLTKVYQVKKVNKLSELNSIYDNIKIYLPKTITNINKILSKKCFKINVCYLNQKFCYMQFLFLHPTMSLKNNLIINNGRNLRDLLFLHYNQPFNFTKSAIIKSYLFKKSLQTFSINRSPMAQKKRRGKEQYYTSFYLNKISINFYNSNVVTERRDKEKYLLCLLKNTNTTRVDSYSRACIFKKFFLHKPLFMSPWFINKYTKLTVSTTYNPSGILLDS